MTQPTRRADAMRRYPALAYVVGAVALALLLPSGLTLPNRGPSTLAEYAPVPGQGQGASPIAELGQAGSAGAGFSARAQATTTTLDADVAPGRIVKKPGTKRCVGNPARQTEDPLSPPCVAFFDGDNGGATSKGVTRDEVIIAMKYDASAQTDRRAGQIVDCALAPDGNDAGSDVLCKAFLRFFNDRFQTYERRVHLFMPHNVSEQDVEAKLHPFAGVGWGGPKYTAINTVFAGQARAQYVKDAPYKITFRPDFEDAAAMAASFVCNKLEGRPARFSGNPLDQTKLRKFAVWVTGPEGYGPTLTAALRSRCGAEVLVQGGAGTDATAVANMRNAGVTTVIVNSQSGALATHTAAEQGWFPEWVVPGATGERDIETNFYGRTLADQAEWAHAMGITFDYRRDATREQMWYRAYREGCPACPEPDATGYSAASFFYDQLSMLFWGIQAAGPRLTPQNVDKGLHAIPPNGSPDPYKPAAYFAPGNYTFVKDATAIWWDPSGQAPGAPQTGCYRLVNGGRRYRAGEWPSGDNDLFASGAPCQGDSFQS